MSRSRTALVALAAVAAASCGAADDGATRTTTPPTASTLTTSTTSTTTTTATTATTATTPGGAEAPPRPGDRPPPVRAVLVAELDQPVALEPVPARPGVFFVAEQEGRVRVLADGQTGEVALDIVEQVGSGGERGLLGLEVSPDGEWLYVHFTNRDGDTRIVEYRLEGAAVDRASARQILAVDQPYVNHNGGHIEFGPDGFLYVALGDGGSRGDPQGNAQNLGTLLGKILRIDPRGGDPYAIPAGNPFTGRAGARGEIWAYGLRNPWQFSFDRVAGTMWIGDVGQNRWEEIDRAPAGSRGGENYGWDRFEGAERFEGEPPPQHELPLHTYARADGNCAVTGGRVYRGQALPALRGWYVFGDYCRGELLALASDATRPAPAFAIGASVGSVVAFAEDTEGELYVLSLQGGVYRLEPPSS